MADLGAQLGDRGTVEDQVEQPQRPGLCGLLEAGLAAVFAAPTATLKILVEALGEAPAALWVDLLVEGLVRHPSFDVGGHTELEALRDRLRGVLQPQPGLDMLGEHRVRSEHRELRTGQHRVRTTLRRDRPVAVPAAVTVRFTADRTQGPPDALGDRCPGLRLSWRSIPTRISSRSCAVIGSAGMLVYFTDQGVCRQRASRPSSRSDRWSLTLDLRPSPL